jgi:hypothetical protein
VEDEVLRIAVALEIVSAAVRSLNSYVNSLEKSSNLADSGRVKSVNRSRNLSSVRLISLALGCGM